MVTIIFSDKEKTREFYIFRESVNESQEALYRAKKRLEAFNYKIVASIIESLDEHFNKDNLHIDEDVIYH